MDLPGRRVDFGTLFPPLLQQEIPTRFRPRFTNTAALGPIVSPSLLQEGAGGSGSEQSTSISPTSMAEMESSSRAEEAVGAGSSVTGGSEGTSPAAGYIPHVPASPYDNGFC